MSIMEDTVESWGIFLCIGLICWAMSYYNFFEAGYNDGCKNPHIKNGKHWLFAENEDYMLGYQLAQSGTHNRLNQNELESYKLGLEHGRIDNSECLFSDPLYVQAFKKAKDLKWKKYCLATKNKLKQKTTLENEKG